MSIFTWNYKNQTSMTIQELRQKLKSIMFQDLSGFQYKFIPENTLKYGNSTATIVNYDIYEENEKFYLIHNSALGTEDMLLDIVSIQPLSINLSSKYSNKHFANWIEQDNHLS